MDRISSYGMTLADAKVHVNGHAFSVWVHPTDNDLLVQRGFGAAMGQSVVEGATLNAVNLMEPKPMWRAAAAQITDPLGCSVTDVYSLDNRITWEAPFTCPAGVDLRAIVKEQRQGLREGQPVQPAHISPAVQ